MERLLISQLLKWKESHSRKPLVLEGARQVGKTWLLKEFGRKYFKDVCYINFEQSDVLGEVFAGDLSPQRIIEQLSIYNGKLIEPEQTLIIFDEVQEMPRALTSLKYFCEEAPEYVICCAGSLLGIALHEGTSFPVGKTDFLHLYPLSFKEFLIANEEKMLVDYIDKGNRNLGVFENRLTDYLKKYMIIGGLPEVVANYAQYHDMVRLSDVFNALLSGYRDDVEKYADNRKEQDSIRYILNYGWTSAGHRIQFAKFTNSSFKSADVSNAFRTLEKTLLLELVYPLTSTSFPILPDLKKSPKLLWLDTGLVNYVAGMQEELLFTTDSDELWNGDIAEHIVAQELLGATTTFGEKRLFWVRDARNSQAEVDFVIRYKSHLLPIEVKTGANSKLRSLHLFMEESKENIALRLWNGPMTSDVITRSDGRPFTLYNIPLYYAGHLHTLMQQTL